MRIPYLEVLVVKLQSSDSVILDDRASEGLRKLVPI